MKVWLSGASGFLGRHLAKDLRDAGHELAVSAGSADLASSLEALQGADVLLHAGFKVDFSPDRGEETDNHRSARAVAEAAKRLGAPHVVFLSGAAVLGVSQSDRARNEEARGTTDAGTEAYLQTRYVQEKLACEDLLGAGPWTRTTLYLTTVYGPGMPEDTRRQLARAGGWSPVLPCPPGGTSFLDLRDALAAVRLVLDRRPAGGFVVSGGNVPYEDLFRTAARVLAPRVPKAVVPLPQGARPFLEKALALRGGLLGPAVVASAFGYKYYSSEKARRVFGWTPRRSLEDALASALLP